MLISSPNPHKHTQINISPNIWAPCSSVKLPHKINHHWGPHGEITGLGHKAKAREELWNIMYLTNSEHLF